MRKNLVVARVGGNSLHRCWLGGGKPRDWDLYLLPYQPMPSQDGVDCVMGDTIPGPKWSGLRALLNEWEGWRAYDYIWFPDDDIYADQRTIDRLFAVAEALGLDLFAPALHPSSYYAHFSTMQSPRFYGRWVGFVEIMMPGFSRSALQRLLPTLDLTKTGWGWGLDSLWPKLLDYENVAIVDGTPVIHTRPVGQMRDHELAISVRAESDAILSSNDCRQVHTTFGAFGPDLKPLDLTPEQLLKELVQGGQYLVERDPRLLYWIFEYQRAHFGGPEYPIAGTPESIEGDP